MDENTQAKFAEKIKELLNMAKKKKNVLEYQEISDFLLKCLILQLSKRQRKVCKIKHFFLNI